MTARQPFAPEYGSNQIVTPAAGSANSPINKSANQVRVVNTGANIGYFRTYSSVAAADKASIATASTADMPVLAGTVTTVTKSLEHDRIAYISATGTTFQIITGEGF